METEPKIIELYIAPGKVKLVYRHLLQLGDGSVRTAEASECAADQRAFWQMHDALNELYDLDVIDEIIVVALIADVRRLETLSPTPDPTHGGGDGPKYRDFIIKTLKPMIDGK